MRLAPSITQINFFISTQARFVQVPDNSSLFGVCNFESKSGSKYWYTDNGVYRLSDHWGEVASCSWIIKIKNEAPEILGFCKWSDFEFMGMDFSKKIANYTWDSLEVQVCASIFEEYRQYAIKNIAKHNLAELKNIPKRMKDIIKEIQENEGNIIINGNFYKAVKIGRKYDIIPIC